MSTTSSAVLISNVLFSSSDATECPSNKRQRIQQNGQNSSDSGLNSSASSLTTITTDLSLILRRFECCVCLEHITPPILQCPNAHLFCQTCRQRFRTPLKCPICSEPLPNKDSRCYPLEQIAVDLGLPFPCKYDSNGCSVTSILNEKKNHENQCQYRPFKCWECNVYEWSGDKEQIIQHMIDVHSYDSYDLDSHNLVIEVNDYAMEDSCRLSELVSFKGQHFVFFLEKDDGIPDIVDPIGTFKAIVLFIGEEKDANQYKYKIKMSDHSSDRSLHFEDRPLTIREDLTKLLDHSKNSGFVFDENLIQRFTDDIGIRLQLNITDEDIPSESSSKSNIIISFDY